MKVSCNFFFLKSPSTTASWTCQQQQQTFVFTQEAAAAAALVVWQQQASSSSFLEASNCWKLIRWCNYCSLGVYLITFKSFVGQLCLNWLSGSIYFWQRRQIFFTRSSTSKRDSAAAGKAGKERFFTSSSTHAQLSQRDLKNRHFSMNQFSNKVL